MTILEPLILELALLGIATGFLAGLLGIGGGMLMVPFITIILAAKGYPADYAVKIAVATSLATICFSCCRPCGRTTGAAPCCGRSCGCSCPASCWDRWRARKWPWRFPVAP